MKLNSKTESLFEKYAAIEQAVRELWPRAFFDACAKCTSICCRPHMADEVLHSTWLSHLADATHGPGWHLKNQNSKCVALTESGCMLKAGKPPFCFSFYCDGLLASAPPFVLVSYLFLSFILTDLCRLNKRRNLLELTREEIENSTEIIEQKIEHAHKQLKMYRDFLCANEQTQVKLSVFMLAEIPGILSQSVRKELLKATPDSNY